MAPLTYTALDVITDALIECGMLAPGETPDAETGQWAFRKFNYLVDVWQAKGAYVWAKSFNLFTLQAGLSPHTIGPAASVPAPTFSTGTQPRPVRIESAALILNTSGSLVDLPMTMRDATWWAQQQTKDIQTDVPTDLYYQADSPIGSLYFWPVPNEADQVRLQYWTTLAQYEQINDPLAGPGGVGVLPPAYRTALMLTLAETLLPGGEKEAHAVLIASAKEARMAVFGNNAKSPRMQTQDFGMPKAGRSTPDWNWVTGNYPGGPPE